MSGSLCAKGGPASVGEQRANGCYKPPKTAIGRTRRSSLASAPGALQREGPRPATKTRAKPPSTASSPRATRTRRTTSSSIRPEHPAGGLALLPARLQGQLRSGTQEQTTKPRRTGTTPKRTLRPTPSSSSLTLMAPVFATLLSPWCYHASRASPDSVYQKWFLLLGRRLGRFVSFQGRSPNFSWGELCIRGAPAPVTSVPSTVVELRFWDVVRQGAGRSASGMCLRDCRGIFARPLLLGHLDFLTRGPGGR